MGESGGQDRWRQTCNQGNCGVRDPLKSFLASPI